MTRGLFFAYGIACHILFLAVFVYMAGFVGNFIVPKSIDSGPERFVGWAVVVDFLLLAIFAAQHSIMARPAFKRIWTRIIPLPIERSTYVLASCLVSILFMWQWQPIASVVWNVQMPALRIGMWCMFVLGWTLVPVVTLLLNHFELVGTRQVWLYFRGKEYGPLPFAVPSLYRFVRHPLYIGWAIAFWTTPTMTIGHLWFAFLMTVYMVAASVLEERDLVAHFGAQYEAYRRDVPKFLPRLFSRRNWETEMIPRQLAAFFYRWPATRSRIASQPTDRRRDSSPTRRRDNASAKESLV